MTEWSWLGELAVFSGDFSGVGIITPQQKSVSIWWVISPVWRVCVSAPPALLKQLGLVEMGTKVGSRSRMSWLSWWMELSMSSVRELNSSSCFLSVSWLWEITGLDGQLFCTETPQTTASFIKVLFHSEKFDSVWIKANN